MVQDTADGEQHDPSQFYTPEAKTIDLAPVVGEFYLLREEDGNLLMEYHKETPSAGEETLRVYEEYCAHRDKPVYHIQFKRVNEINVWDKFNVDEFESYEEFVRQVVFQYFDEYSSMFTAELYAMLD